MSKMRFWLFLSKTNLGENWTRRWILEDTITTVLKSDFTSIWCRLQAEPKYWGLTHILVPEPHKGYLSKTNICLYLHFLGFSSLKNNQKRIFLRDFMVNWRPYGWSKTTTWFFIFSKTLNRQFSVIFFDSEETQNGWKPQTSSTQLNKH